MRSPRNPDYGRPYERGDIDPLSSGVRSGKSGGFKGRLQELESAREVDEWKELKEKYGWEARNNPAELFITGKSGDLIEVRQVPSADAAIREARRLHKKNGYHTFVIENGSEVWDSSFGWLGSPQSNPGFFLHPLHLNPSYNTYAERIMSALRKKDADDSTSLSLQADIQQARSSGEIDDSEEQQLTALLSNEIRGHNSRFNKEEYLSSGQAAMATSANYTQQQNPKAWWLNPANPSTCSLWLWGSVLAIVGLCLLSARHQSLAKGT